MVDKPNKTDAPIAFFLLFKLANTMEDIVKPSGILCSRTAINTTKPNPLFIAKLATIDKPSKKVCIIMPINVPYIVVWVLD